MTTTCPTSFYDVVRKRQSIRAFRPQPIPRADIEAILLEAQMAPSNCNSQPWQVEIVSGARLASISNAMIESMEVDHYTLDFPFEKASYPEPFRDRIAAQGRNYYQALGVAREDADKRADVVRRNVEFFGAPHAAFLFMPDVEDGVRVAADLGMYAQTLLLALVARGYAGVPQTSLSYFADLVRNALRVSDDIKLLLGISFGTADMTHPAAAYREPRASLADTVHWHD